MFYCKMRNNEIISLNIPYGIYEPREDSLLLAKVLEEEFESGEAKNENKKTVLEIGCGSGLLSIISAKRGCDVLAADINPAAVACAKRNAELNGASFETIQSDLFQHINGKFDLIIFNPPYLPEEQTEGNRAWAGGKNLEVITEFIKSARRHLNNDGKLLVLISSLTKPENIMGKFADNDFDAKIIAERKIPWEKLSVVFCRGNIESNFSNII